MKRFLPFFLALVMVNAPSLAVAQAVTVVVNGQPVSFAQPPMVRAGRVFVPLRGVFERLGASVVYANGQINATRHGRTISLTIGSTQATVAEEPQTIDVAPFIVADTTYVPLRFVTQALGASVRWDDSTSTVTILSMPSAAVPPPQEAPYPRSVRFANVWPTGTISNPYPTLRFQFDRPVRLAEFRISVDGRNVNSGVRQDGPNFSVVLPWPLEWGAHHVRVAGTTESGGSFDLVWNFVRG